MSVNMDSFMDNTDIFIEFPKSSCYIVSSSDFVMQHSVKRPPEKVLKMPSTTSSSPPASPDGVPNKKAPPPVASKPARPRSSLLSIISNQTTSSTSTISESTEKPSVSTPTCNDQHQNPSQSNDEVFEKENLMPPIPESSMPPPPSQDVLAQMITETSTDGENGADEADFPPPPDDIQIQEALDKINSKYDTSANAIGKDRVDLDMIDSLPPPPVEDTQPSASGQINESSAPNSMEMQELSDSTNDQLKCKEDNTVMSHQHNQAEKVIQAPNKTDLQLPLHNKQPDTLIEKHKAQQETIETPNSLASPLSEGSANSELSLEDELTSGGDIRDENHMTHLAIHSSFSALDTKTSSHESLENNISPSKEETTSIDSKQEVNHNDRTMGSDVYTTTVASSQNIFLTASSTTSTANTSISATSNSTGMVSQTRLSNTTAESALSSTASSDMTSSATSTPKTNTFGVAATNHNTDLEKTLYDQVGETIQVQLRPIKNTNKKSEYAVPVFDRSSSELKRVTFQEPSSQQITPAVTPYKSAKEQERIKRTGLSEDDVAQTEIFYKGHKTEVMVCHCLATLYFAEGMSADHVTVDEWKPEHIGIPVLIYDTGDGKRARGLTMVFAEKGTGFSLWKTEVNYESRWEPIENVFHRLRIPGTKDKLAGIAFQDEESAKAFYQKFKDVTSNPELNVLNNPNITNKKKKDKRQSIKKKPQKLPKKIDISLPCQFSHVTQLKQSEDGILALTMVDDETASSEDGTIDSK